MQQTFIEPTTFSIEFQGNLYPCQVFERAAGALYRIDFGKTCLFLSRANAPDGSRFWTAIPEDTKINHIVQEFGSLIENHYK